MSEFGFPSGKHVRAAPIFQDLVRIINEAAMPVASRTVFHSVKTRCRHGWMDNILDNRRTTIQHSYISGPTKSIKNVNEARLENVFLECSE